MLFIPHKLSIEKNLKGFVKHLYPEIFLFNSLSYPHIKRFGISVALLSSNFFSDNSSDRGFIVNL